MLNIKGLKEVQQDLNKKNSNDDLYMYHQDISKDGTHIRVLPPVPELNGMYFVEQTLFWLDKVPYVSPKTFGQPCLIEKVLKAAKDDDDEDVVALADEISEKYQYLIPCLLLDCEYDDDNELIKNDVIGVRVLACGPQLMKEINRIVTNAQYQNGTEDGITDMEKGWNITVSKEGTGKTTKYTAIGWVQSTKYPKQYYKDVPNVLELTRKRMYSDDYLGAVMENYFYGEELPEKTEPRYKAVAKKEAEQEEEEETPKKKTARKPVAKKATSSTKKKAVKVPEEEEEEDAPKKATKKRSLLSDINMDEEDE